MAVLYDAIPTDRCEPNPLLRTPLRRCCHASLFIAYALLHIATLLPIQAIPFTVFSLLFVSKALLCFCFSDQGRSEQYNSAALTCSKLFPIFAVASMSTPLLYNANPFHIHVLASSLLISANPVLSDASIFATLLRFFLAILFNSPSAFCCSPLILRHRISTPLNRCSLRLVTHLLQLLNFLDFEPAFPGIPPLAHAVVLPVVQIPWNHLFHLRQQYCDFELAPSAFRKGL